MKGIVFLFVFLAVSLFPIAILAQRITNIWQGGFSTSWAGGINWSQGHVPTASEDVNIPSGAPRYPYINSSSTYSCNSVYMASGTSLTIQGVLNVTIDFSCYGSLTMDNELADLNIGDDLLFYNGSNLSIPFPGTDINITDDLNFYSGSNINPDYGDFKLTGANSNIYVAAAASVYNLYIDSPNCEHSAGTADLTVKGSFTVYNSRSFHNYTSGNTFFQGDVWAGSNSSIVFNDGFVRFTGNISSSVTITTTSYFNDVVISKSSGASVILNSLLIINGNLGINDGILDSNGNNINIKGNWHENYDSSAFDESPGTTATVHFLGTAAQYIYGYEEFNKLSNYNSNGLVIIHNVQALMFNNHAACRLDVQGSMYANQEFDNIIGSIDVTGYLNLTFASDQSADIIDDVTINPGGEFHIHGGVSPSYLVATATLHPDGVLNFHDIGFEILSGAYGNMNDGDIYVTGDFKVHEYFYSLSGGSVHFLGGGDSYFIPPSTGFTGLYINKQSSNDYVWVLDRIITLTGDLVIENGNLWMDGHDLYLHNNAQISDDLYMAGGSIFIAPNKTFDVLSGGWLVVTGIAGEPAYVSRIGDSGYYNLNVHEDGVIGAEYAVFQCMGPSGVNLQYGSRIDQQYCFYRCTFRYGADAGTLLTINNDQNVLFCGVAFPANTWGGNFNVTKTNDEGNLLFVLAEGSFSGAANESDVYNRIEWGNTIPPVTDLTIELLPASGFIKLQAYYPYEGAYYTLYKSASPHGPWDAYITGHTSISTIWTYLPTDPMTFFRVILWQE